MSYLFGDSDLAAHRLEIVHEVFAATSRPLLQEVAMQPLGLAIDLGCGPGVCTRFLAEVTGSRLVAGLDSSARFIALAKQARMSDRVRFFVHDVTLVPFPVGPADLLYGRLLLTHLLEPGIALERWATQLCAGGRLVLEEVEDIRADQPVLRSYLEVVAAALAHRGNRLYVGPILDALPDPSGLHREISRVARLPVSNAQAATMFLMNLQTWRNDEFVKAHFGDAMLAPLDAELRAIAQEDSDRSQIEWSVRQIVYRRR